VHSRRDWRGWAALGLTIIAVLPVLVVLVTRTGRCYTPVSDIAPIDLRVRDVWSSHIPLVGAYSRGWNHPGPLLLWLLAIPSGLAGQAPWATLVGGAILQGVAIVASARLALRRGGLPLALVVLTAMSLSYAKHGVFLSAWNPDVAFPFFTLYLLEIWSVADGEVRALVPATIVGTFLVQTHFGYFPLVVVSAVWAALVRVRTTRGGRRVRQEWSRAVKHSVAFATVLWVPTAIEQFTGSPGNLTRMARYFFSASEPTAGLRVGAGLLAAEFRIPPPWLGGHEHANPFNSAVYPAPLTWLLVPALVVALGLVATHRSRSRADRRVIVLIGLLLITGVIAIAQAPELKPWLFLWRRILPPFTFAATGWALARWLGLSRYLVVTRVCGFALLALLIVRSLTLTVEVAGEKRAFGPFERDVQSLVHQLERAGLPGRPVLLRDPESTSGVEYALVNELDRRGVPVRVDEPAGHIFGTHRVSTTRGVSQVWYVTQSGRFVSFITARPGASVLARTTPLSPSEEANLTNLQRRLGAQLRRAGRVDVASYVDSPLLGLFVAGVRGIDQNDVNRAVRLNARVSRSGHCRCAVVAFRPSEVPRDLLPGVGPALPEATGTG